MKAYRPKSTNTKVYVPALEKLEALAKKANKDRVVVLSEIIDKEHKLVFKK